jgi:hypothetical protein
MSAEAAAVARRAAEIIQERGQCKGVYAIEQRVCLWGALIEAAGLTARWNSAQDIPDHIYGALHSELRSLFPDDSDLAHPGAAFNDRRQTDERDVARVLLQVADRLDVAS